MNPSASQAMSRARSGLISRSSLGRSFGRISRYVATSVHLRNAGKFLRRQLWTWPFVAAAIIGLAGWLVDWAVKSELQASWQGQLTTILEAEKTALRLWMTQQENNAYLIANDERIHPLIVELCEAARKQPNPKMLERELYQLQALEQLREKLAAATARFSYSGFFVVTEQPTLLIVGAEIDAPLAKPIPSDRQDFFKKLLDGHPSVSKPSRSHVLLANKQGEMRANLPVMFAGAPILGPDGKPIAALAFRMNPEEKFSEILQIARSGESGETYAFDKDGIFLSSSRFDEDLKQIGLLADEPEVISLLTLRVRNPGVDMTQNTRPKLRRLQQPMTLAAQEATEGRSGLNVAGYPDYRGVPVIGAWDWIPEYDMGLVTEIDYAEAYAPLKILRWAYGSLLFLLFLSSVGLFFFMWYAARQQRELQKAVLAAKQIGQYALMEKLGEGGMGTVYRGQHAMLRRPTAVKLLNAESINDAAIVRFEREVQMTSSLTHPNTIAIYDYGRTPEGIFYYAMELLEGSDLETLVKTYGPLPEPRALHILKQVCGSLSEAHQIGLIHRDIKPANIFLTRRGGMHDFVKVLDFGLVKTVGGEADTNVTSAGSLTGTPLYISPEAINNPDAVDARSDVYAIGGVAYFLLTGTPTFQATNVLELLTRHTKEMPESPSRRLGKPLHPVLERLIMQCLAKSPLERPGNAAMVLRELERVTLVETWSAEDASFWWQTRGFAREANGQSPATFAGNLPPKGTVAGTSAAPAPSAPPTQKIGEVNQTMMYTPGMEDE